VPADQGAQFLEGVGLEALEERVQGFLNPFFACSATTVV